MKFAAITTIFAVVSFAAAAVEEAEQPHLRSGLVVNPEKANRRLSFVTDIINRVIVEVLPSINSAISGSIDDPIVITQDATTQEFPLTMGLCANQRATVAAKVRDITGLNSLTITKLEVRDGTDNVCIGFPITIDGTFDFDLETTENTTLTTDLEFTADACPPVATTAVTSVSQLKGGGDLVLSAIIENNEFQILKAEVGRLTLGCGEVTTVVANPGAYAEVVSEIESGIGTDFCEYIETTAIEDLKAAINAALGALRSELGYLSSAAYAAGFLAANSPTIVRTFLAGELSETMAESRAFLNEP